MTHQLRLQQLAKLLVAQGLGRLDLRGPPGRIQGGQKAQAKACRTQQQYIGRLQV